MVHSRQQPGHCPIIHPIGTRGKEHVIRICHIMVVHVLKFVLYRTVYRFQQYPGRIQIMYQRPDNLSSFLLTVYFIPKIIRIR